MAAEGLRYHLHGWKTTGPAGVFKELNRRHGAYRLAQGPEEKLGHAGFTVGFVLMGRRAAGRNAVLILVGVTWRSDSRLRESAESRSCIESTHISASERDVRVRLGVSKGGRGPIALVREHTHACMHVPCVGGDVAREPRRHHISGPPPAELCTQHIRTHAHTFRALSASACLV